MTFEEWFHKEYEPADLQLKHYAEEKENLRIPAELYLEDIQKAFLAGLKAGKLKWHKVKTGDLPPEDTKVLAFMAGGEVCIAHFYRKNVWDKIGIVIAWREIPKYTEE